MSVQKVLLCAFHCKPKLSKVSLWYPVLEIFPKFRESEPKLIKITMREMRSRLLFQCKVESGYISAHKLESERSESFALSISMQSKGIRS